LLALRIAVNAPKPSGSPAPRVPSWATTLWPSMAANSALVARDVFA
jgi:hypothetical protein